MEVFLYNSTVCRLCGEENDNGTLLYSSDDNNENLSEIINTYLPIKVSDDGELPRTICPGCNIQLEAAVEFLNLIINGQKILRELHQREKEYKKSVLNSPSTEDIITEKIVYEVNTSNGVYQVEHPIALQVAGLDKPKRKRGRPPKKPKTPEELAQEAAAREQEFVEMKKNEEKDVELSGKRRRKTPPRLKEAVQGKELERILKEEGVIDGEEIGRVKKEIDKVPKEPEVIGHLEESGELIVVGKGKGRGRPKGRMRPNREQCAICGATFSCVGRYMSHVAQHGPVRYQCGCGARFPTRLAFTHHQRDTRHTGQRVLPDTHSPEATKTEPGEEVTVVLEEEETQPEAENEVSVVEEAPVMTSLPDLNPEPIAMKEEAEETNSEETKTEVLEVVESEVVAENVENNSISEETIVETAPEEDNVQEVETTATGKPKLKCNHCDKMYSSKQSKSLHMKAAHEGLRPFACVECGLRFSYPRSLANHAAAHARRRPGHRGYACDLCGKVLSHPSSVAYHKEAEHAGQRFVCSKCGKHFKHKQLLQRHQLVHTHHRPYSCTSCSATFKSKANLLHHHLLHTGVKKFTCEICKHKFAHKTSLTLHMRWHAGCKPYMCKTCGKCFSQKGNLSEHARIHSGEKPFACGRCPRRFTTSSQHRLHLRNHCSANHSNVSNSHDNGGQMGPNNRIIQKQISLLTSANQPQLIEQTYSLEEVGDKAEEGGELQERVIYVAYDVHGHDAPDIHILNAEQADRLEMSKSMSSCSLFGGESLLAPLAPLEPLHTLAPMDSQLHTDHMPVTDEQGNPLHFTMQDGTRLAITSADGKSLQVITQDGQTIPVEINGFAEEEEVDNPDTIVHQLNLQKTVETNVGSPVTHFFTIV